MRIIRQLFAKLSAFRLRNVKRISIQGPLDRVGDRLMLQIPLEAGGRELAPFAKGIGQVEGGCLKVEILPWLAEKLNVEEGRIVVVDNLEGKFRITRTDQTEQKNGAEPPPAG